MKKIIVGHLFLLAGLLSCMAQQQAAAPPPSNGVEGYRLLRTDSLPGTLHHVQGVALDAAHLWVTAVDAEARRGYLYQFNRETKALERTVELTDGVRFHPGGLSLDGDSLWVPVAEYRPQSSAVIVELDKRTLTERRRFSVADHVGCVAVAGDEVIVGNWGSKRFYVLDRTGRVLRSFENPTANQYQDLKFAEGRLVASGLLSKTEGAVDWYTWPNLQRIARRSAGQTDRGRVLTAEGMAVEGARLFLLPEDGPSRLFEFVQAHAEGAGF